MKGPTPSQTVGPFFTMILGRAGEDSLTGDDDPDRIVIEGVVYDGDGHHVEDALIELWQADASGYYHHPEGPSGSVFAGFGRAHTEFDTGRFSFQTVKPGPVPDPEGEQQAPHISLIVQGRGMLNPLFTRIYFSDESEGNARDLVLGMVPEERRTTLIAEFDQGSEPPTYRFDLRLQGDDETVFFDF